ncbi:TetR/AcrR family transcriptional regulator [Paenibacillus sp. MBLB4367]|uniref:TetR/AcrR family transcriptional regulator n=1 Tax=Paenibacillus sp. MBLB4367 TaxID=3384767 RepID=UPI0039081BF2
MLRSARKQQLKDQIFMQALRLFNEKGFDNVTVEEITQACDIAKGTFYNYFPRKESILLHFGMMQLDSVNQSINRYADIPDLREKLMLLFGDLFQRYAAQPGMIRQMIAELLRSGLLMQEEISMIQAFRNALVPLLEEAQRNGQLRERAACEDAAAVLTGVYFNALMVWLSTDGKAGRLEDIFRRHFDIVWEGMQAGGGKG